MPNITWEWKFGPQTVISALMLAVMCVGFIEFFWDIKQDTLLAKTSVATVQKETVELKGDVRGIASKQERMISDLADSKAKIDNIMPTVQRIEDFLLRRTDGRTAYPH